MGPQKPGWETGPECGHEDNGSRGSSSQVTVPRAALECLTLKPQVEWGDLAKGLRTAQRKPGTPRRVARGVSRPMRACAEGLVVGRLLGVERRVTGGLTPSHKP